MPAQLALDFSSKAPQPLPQPVKAERRGSLPDKPVSLSGGNLTRLFGREKKSKPDHRKPWQKAPLRDHLKESKLRKKRKVPKPTKPVTVKVTG